MATDVRNTVYEEHTVSGSIVTFSDGANSVPLKKCEVTLAASLDGYTEIDVVASGKNLFSDDSTQSILTNKRFEIALPAGDYTMAFDFVSTTAESTPLYLQCAYNLEDGTSTSYNPVTITEGRSVRSFTLARNAVSLIIYANTQYITSQGVTTVIQNIQLEAGSSASDYEPYSGDTYTASLGRTIYGGKPDVVNGQGKSTHANVKVSDLTWVKQTASNRDFFIAQVSDMKTGTPKDIDSVLPYGGEITVAAMADKSLASWTNSLRIYDTDIATVSELLEAYGNDGISYPLATPIDFTFTPVQIDSKLGFNTIWAEQGTNVEVTYYSEREVINNYNVTATQLTAIADAIREKKQSTAPILFEDFPNEILTIETGGGGEDAVTWLFTAGQSGGADSYTYTVTEDGLYLAVAIRYQSTGCSISLPDGGTTVLTSSLLSNKVQLKVVRLEANQRIQIGLYNGNNRGAWIFKLNVTPSAIMYSRGSDEYGDISFSNRGTSNNVLSVIISTGTNKCYKWDKTMECFMISPLTTVAHMRIMYGIDMTMPTIVESQPITGQWVLNLAED